MAANGQDALTALERERYDLVFMDVQMPVMDGLEATRQIRQRWPAERQPRIVAMTANALQSDREACLQAGMDDYLRKPVQAKELRAALEHWGRWVLDSTVRSMVAHPVSQPPPIDETPAVLDAALLASLRRGQAPTEPDIVTQLIQFFFEESPPLLKQIKTAMENGNAAQLRHAAHTLKGSSASLGAQELSAQSAALEKLARKGAMAEAAARWPALEQTYARTCRALEAERRESS